MSKKDKRSGDWGVGPLFGSLILHALILFVLGLIVLTATREPVVEAVVRLEPVGRPQDRASESAGGSVPSAERTSETSASQTTAPLPAPAMESAVGSTPSASRLPIPDPTATDPALALLNELTDDASAAHTGEGDNPLVDGTSEGFQEMLGGIRGRGLDVVFVIDATESMRDIMEQAKERMRDIIGVITGVLAQEGRPPRNVRFGFVAFKDYGDDYGINAVRVLQLTNDYDEVKKFLEQLQTSGGGDDPEPIHEALATAIHRQMGWRNQAKNIIVLIGDAPVHPSGRGDAVEAASRFARRNRGTVNVVDVGTARGGVLGDFTAIAEAGDGTATMLASTDAFWQDMIVTVFGRRFERDVQLIVERYAKSNR